MATIHNSELSQELQDAAKIQVSRDKIPSEIAEKVIPVVEVNPRLTRKITHVLAGTNSVGGNTLIYTVPTGKRFLIQACNLSYIKDAAATAALYWIQITIRGVTRYLIRIPSITLTADKAQLSQSFPAPIELFAGDTISVYCDAFHTVQTMHANIYGCEIDNPNA